MRLHVHQSAEHLASALAQNTADALARNPHTVLGLPAGRTPVLLYRELVAISRARSLDWSRARTFSLDEFVTPRDSSRQPYRQFMHDHLLAHVAVTPALVDSPNGRAVDLDAECDRYERAIEAAGGLDLLILGIGANGHIGFNEPGSPPGARTHVASLTAESRAANAWLFGGRIDRVPPRALTMGIATILGARAIVLVATGVEKAAAVAAMANGGVTPDLPASFLQSHAGVTVLLDEAAAVQLA